MHAPISGSVQYLLRQAFREATSGAPRPVQLYMAGYAGESIEMAEAEMEVLIEEPHTRYPYSISTRPPLSAQDKTPEELLTVGEQIVNIEKAFNVLHCRFGRKDYYPPKRHMTSTISRGEFEGKKLDPQKWDEMLTEYYAVSS